MLLTLVAVLVTSGVAKLRDQRATRDAFDALRVPGLVPAEAAARALPWVEMTLALLMLVSPSTGLVPVAVLVLGLMLTYTWVIVRALGFDEPVTCSCFGALGRHEIDRTTLARNILLSLLAAAAVWFALEGGSAPAAVSQLDGAGWAMLAATSASAVVAVLVVGGVPTEVSPPAAEEDLLDYERRPIPYGVLQLSDGTTATLTELATTQARLVVLLNQGCGPCIRIGEKLDGWAERLDPDVGVVAVHATAEAATEVREHAPELATWEPDLNVRRVFGTGTPTAVLLGADGWLAGGPASGEDAIVELVDAVLEQIDAPPTEDSVV